MRTSAKNDILAHLKKLFSETGKDISHHSITDFFPAIIYVFDHKQQKLKYINESRINEALGFSLDEIKEWDNDFTKMIFKDDLENVKQEMDKYGDLEDDDEYTYNCRLNHKEGDWRYYRARGTILDRDKDGKPDSVIFVAEDITEKTKSDQEVSALKQLIDDTEDMLQFGSWSWDLNIDKMYWTDGMYKLLGYEKEDVKANISNDFFLKHLSAKDAAGLTTILKKAIEAKAEFEFTCTITTGLKEEKIVSLKGKVVTLANGDAVKVLGIIRDITRQTKITRDLIHYREMIHEREAFLNQGSWETILHSGETIWSKGMYRLFGYDPEKEMGTLPVTNELHLSHMSEEEVIRSKKDWQNTIANKDTYTREASIITKDGMIRQLETYGKVLRDHNGVVEKVIGTTRDVTRMREYERSLEEKIQELNRSNTALEEFAYIASHDLQEPLRKLTTFSERLQLKYAPLLGKDGLVYLDRMVAATENMRTLIENLLEFSRTARSDKHFMRTSLSKLLEEVKADLELKIEESGSKIQAVALPDLEVIPSQIKQLFNNLLSNSIKFKKQHQPCIITITCDRLSMQDKKTHYLRPEKNYYKLTIADNGIGFDKIYEERIFQIFQRLHGKAEYPGSGIGLAICKKIVENHSGIIFADGHLGEGAVFTVILPEMQFDLKE